MLYMLSMHMAPAFTGEPGNAPASKARYDWAARMVPSFFTPIFIHV